MLAWSGFRLLLFFIPNLPKTYLPSLVFKMMDCPQNLYLIVIGPSGHMASALLWT